MKSSWSTFSTLKTQYWGQGKGNTKIKKREKLDALPLFFLI